jgi:inorganic triphosphatase YgiF
MYKAIITDRLQSLPSHTTKLYETYKEAHDAGHKLASKHFTDERYNIDVVRDLKEYVGAVWLAERLAMTQQNVSLAGQRALKPTYRGEFLKPDAVVEGRPLWEKMNAVKYVHAQPWKKNFEPRYIEKAMAEYGVTVDGKAVWEWIETQVGNGLDGRHILTDTLGGVKVDFHIEVTHVQLDEDKWLTDICLSKIRQE